MDRSLLRSTTQIRLSIRLESAGWWYSSQAYKFAGTLAIVSRILLAIVVKGESVCVYKSTQKEKYIVKHIKEGKDHELSRDFVKIS